MIERIATLPSTNFRIAVTLFVVVLTAARYLTSGMNFGLFSMPPFNPGADWLAFLAAMSGLDMAQFWAKRATYRGSPPATPDVEDAGAQRHAPAYAAPAPAASGSPAQSPKLESGIVAQATGPSLSAASRYVKDD